mmetsp:Transcript_7605/g.22245  ORF Transcript_7605/g.22245 Transcript_7605/m.22245 type:complete len:166 (+) Transcript_7605:1360-1857(+)
MVPPLQEPRDGLTDGESATDAAAKNLGGLERADSGECSRAAVCLALGSSLSVTPANELPLLAKEALVVVNLQATDLDARAKVRVHAETDVFMGMLLDSLLTGVGHADDGAPAQRDIPRHEEPRALSAAAPGNDMQDTHTFQAQRAAPSQGSKSRKRKATGSGGLP